MVDLIGFIQYMKLQNLSKGTIGDYSFEIKKLPKGFEEQKEYLLKNRSKRMLICAYRKYLRYLKSINKIDSESLHNLLDVFKLPKKRGKTNKAIWYSKKEWGNILRKLPNKCAKMAAYMQLQFGLRLGEIVNLRREEDIDFEKGFINIQSRKGWHPKHKRERSIPIIKSQEKIIQKWINQMPKRIQHKYLLWHPGKNKIRKQVKERTIQRWYFNSGIKSHDLRRSFAKALYYGSNKDIKLVSIILGHSNVAVTSNYLGLETEEIQSKFEKAMA